MPKSTIATVENTAAIIPNAIATESAPIPDVDYATAETVGVDPEVEDQAAEDAKYAAEILENAIADIGQAIDYAQKTLDISLGYEWKSGARKAIKAIAEYHASLLNLRDKVTADNLTEVINSVESILDSIELAASTAKAAKPTDSEGAAYQVLHGNGWLLIDGEEYLIPSEGIAIVRYTRQTKQGQLSVLFVAPTQGSALLPIGLITSDTVKRFADVRLTPENQKAIAQAKSKWCESFKAAIKADKLSQKEQDNNQRFKSAGFSRI